MSPPPRRGYGSVRVIKQKTGVRYQARYVGPDRIRRTLGTFGQRRQAERALDKVRDRIDAGLWTPPGQVAATFPTFSEAAAEWLTRRPEPLKARTLAHYRRLLDRLVLPVLGEMALDTISEAVIDNWYYQLDPGTPVQRAHAYSLTRSVLGRAFKKHHLGQNPAQVEGATVVRPRDKRDVLTPAQVEQLVEAMPERFKALVLLACWGALRYGEVTELRRRDLDMRAGVVKVRRGVVRVDGTTLVGDPKSFAGKRDVALPPHIVPAIARHLLEHVAPGASSLLFPAATLDEHGHEKHLAPSAFYRPWYRARAGIGRPDLRVHDLRHVGLTLAAQAGATTAELMARAGHSTAAASLIYQHASRARDKAIAQELSRMAKGASE